MIDSHTHLYCEDFDEDRQAMLQRAKDAGVTHVILPNENMNSVPRLKAMQQQWPDYVSITIGIHPEEIGKNFRQELDAMHALLQNDNFVAVGEVGIDLYWDKTYREEQMEALNTQLHWCKEVDIPFIIHCRNGLDECLNVMDNFGEPLPNGVFHSFTGNANDVEAVRKRGDFYFGVNGIVTFKKSDVPAILPIIGLNRILLETDSPYLAPVPHRGKRNESANIPFICDSIAKYLGLSAEEVSAATDCNTKALFGI